MCPFCLATTMGFIVAGAASTGGLATLAFKMSRKKYEGREFVTNSNERRNPDVNEHNQQPKNSVA
jgi:hypothetical protein